MILKLNAIRLTGEKEDLYINANCIVYVHSPIFSQRDLKKYSKACEMIHSKIVFCNNDYAYVAQTSDEIFAEYVEND